MSLSRAELEAMDRDELVDAIVDLADQVDDQQARLEAMSRWKEATTDRLGDVMDQNERLRAENEQLRARLNDIEAKAEQALATAGANDPADRTKTDHARILTRNLLVTEAADVGSDTVVKVTVADIKERAKPERSLRWQTVKNAWSDLQAEWPQFRDTTKDGSQALGINADAVTTGLVRRVERDLGRTDLAKRFVGDSGEGGT